MNSKTKLTVKFVKSYGTFGLYRGAKNLGTNFATDKAAVAFAQKKFPGCTIVLKGFYS
jgi:hypothetical protein